MPLSKKTKILLIVIVITFGGAAAAWFLYKYKDKINQSLLRGRAWFSNLSNRVQYLGTWLSNGAHAIFYGLSYPLAWIIDFGGWVADLFIRIGNFFKAPNQQTPEIPTNLTGRTVWPYLHSLIRH